MKFAANDTMTFWANEIPSYRTQKAIGTKVQNNILLNTWGGLGDQVCAEPTLRYAFQFCKGAELSLESEWPELFGHLKFKRVFNRLRGQRPNDEEFMRFNMIERPPHLAWEFISHAIVNCVDYPSLNAFRMQLPTSEKQIMLSGKEPPKDILDCLEKKSDDGVVFIHAGKHWPSKTFPKEWWDSVIKEIISLGNVPVLIGADINRDGQRGTVDVDSTNCIDLRNKTSIQEITWLLQRVPVLITNDSSPLHLAASKDPATGTGDCWIGYIATCKHPDYITHWRKNDDGEVAFQWREENLSLGGLWDHTNNCPNQDEEVMIHKCDPDLLNSWLPDPVSVAQWANDRL